MSFWIGCVRNKLRYLRAPLKLKLSCRCLFANGWSSCCEGVGLVNRAIPFLGGVHRYSTSVKDGRSATGGARGKGWRERRDQWRGRTAHIMSACGWLWKYRHRSDLSHAVQCAMWRHADTRWTRLGTIKCSCWCALCGNQSWWSCCHWCRSCNRATSPRKHNLLLNSHFCVLSVQLCTCSQTVSCDRQFFLVAIYCTLLHREYGSFGVLCLHLICRLQWTAVSCKRSICNKVEFKKVLSRRIFPNTAIQQVTPFFQYLGASSSWLSEW